MSASNIEPRKRIKSPSGGLVLLNEEGTHPPLLGTQSFNCANVTAWNIEGADEFGIEYWARKIERPALSGSGRLLAYSNGWDQADSPQPERRFRRAK